MGRRPWRRARQAKRRKSEERSDEEEYIAASDSDRGSSGSDIELKRMRNFKRKGKAVIDVSDHGEEAWLSMKDLGVGGNGDYLVGKGKAVIDVNDEDEEQGTDGDDDDFMKQYSVEDVGREFSFGSESDIDIDVPRVTFALRKKRTAKKKKKGKHDPPLLWEIWEEENQKWVDHHQADDIDVDNIDENVAAMVEPPPDLLLPLMRFQKEYLAWAIKQEESDVRGGILADEMGMGKTIQAISLVLTARAIHPIGSGNSGETASTSSLSLPKIKSTLVICPVVAVSQWKNEIARFTAKDSTTVLVYHGAKRDKGFDQFSEYDFVLTTYSTIEADYRKYVMPPKEKCNWCGKLLLPQKMTIHQRYYCGPDAVKTVKQSKQMRKKKQPIKVGESIKKSSVEEDGTWETEFGKGNEPGKSKKRSRELKKIKISNPKDSSTAAGQESSTRISVLHCVKWNRIILDEAHFIKDRRSSTARAVFALESSYKWALSGTPLQNRVGELYSLIRFLQISPYSYYFCKDCDCKILDYSSTRECPGCVHSTVRHFFWWNKYVAKPIQSRGYANEGRRAMILLKHKLLRSIVLRRTKKSRAADLALPPRIVSLRRDTLDNKEEDFYEALYSNSQSQFNTYIAQGTLMNNYAHIFDLLTRLRQAVDHPYLVVYPRTRAPPSGNGTEEVELDQDCDICKDPVEDPVVTSCCEHVFCRNCLLDHCGNLRPSDEGKMYPESSLEGVSCPSFDHPLSVDFKMKRNQGEQSSKRPIKGFKKSSILNQICLTDFQSSTKIDALREEIRNMVDRDGSAKGIVFSQFTTFLDLISYSLQKSGIKYVQLVGSMNIAARDNAIEKFINDPDCKIFLMSLKAGGVALNLTVASHVFLMDPWWNPAVERQAQDRIHRIGQYKPIRIVRFVIENTIEERILKLQEKKELVFEGTVGGSSQALGKLTEADLRFLFHN